MSETRDLDAMIAQLWETLGPAQLALARSLADDLAQYRATGDPAPWLRVRDAAHRLAGSLGSLGQHDAGVDAVHLEELTAGVEDPGEALLDEVAVRSRSLLAHLEAATT